MQKIFTEKKDSKRVLTKKRFSQIKEIKKSFHKKKRYTNRQKRFKKVFMKRKIFADKKNFIKKEIHADNHK